MTGFWTVLAWIEFGLVIIMALALNGQGRQIDRLLDLSRQALGIAARYKDEGFDWDWPLAEDFTLSTEED